VPRTSKNGKMTVQSNTRQCGGSALGTPTGARCECHQKLTSPDRGVMWRIAVRDLQWRRRRLLISTLGTSLVFTMALVLAGLTGSFGIEASNTIKGLGADAWIVREGTSGPFTGEAGLPESAVHDIGRLPGVTQSAGLIFSDQTVGSGSTMSETNIFGIQPGRVGAPVPATGRQPKNDSEAMVDDALPYGIGQRLVVGNSEFTVVGLLDHSTLLAGTPNVFITLHADQRMLFGGRGLISAVLTKGTPMSIPSAYRVLTLAQVKSDMTTPLAKAQQVVTFIELFLWLIAGSIVGSVIYVSALEKTRDFAVLKATGSSNPQLMSVLALQAIVISVAAAAVAAVAAVLVAPAFPILVSIPLWAILALPLLAVALGLLASIAGLRRALAVEPAFAFGGP
jgi:putative ABC transport system permease protein